MSLEDEEAGYPCPACDARLYGWATARHPSGGEEIVLDHCESCGLVVTRGRRAPDVAVELSDLDWEGGTIVAPNRESLQGGIGGPGWAGLEPEQRRLHLNPRAATLLLRKRGIEVLGSATPFSGRSYAAMLQTLVNAFTLRPNFVRNARAGRLPRGDLRGRLGFALDAVFSVLVAIPLSALALILELVGSLIGRGGVMRLETAPGGIADGDG